MDAIDNLNPDVRNWIVKCQTHVDHLMENDAHAPISGVLILDLAMWLVDHPDDANTFKALLLLADEFKKNAGL